MKTKTNEFVFEGSVNDGTILTGRLIGTKESFNDDSERMISLLVVATRIGNQTIHNSQTNNETNSNAVFITATFPGRFVKSSNGTILEITDYQGKEHEIQYTQRLSGKYRKPTIISLIANGFNLHQTGKSDPIYNGVDRIHGFSKSRDFDSNPLIALEHLDGYASKSKKRARKNGPITVRHVAPMPFTPIKDSKPRYKVNPLSEITTLGEPVFLDKYHDDDNRPVESLAEL